MSDPSINFDYPLGYYDKPIEYPDPRGKSDIARAAIEGENEDAHLAPSTIKNTIVIDSSNKANKINVELGNINKTSKESIEI